MTAQDSLSLRDAFALLNSGQQRPKTDADTQLTIDNVSAKLDDTAGPGAILGFGADRYRIISGLEGRAIPVLMPPQAIRPKVRVHCGLHKCLTMFQRRVYKNALELERQSYFARKLHKRQRFKHFYHYVRDFYASCTDYQMTSLSGQALDLESFRDIRVVRFIRDPRDLLVSGYHFHKRGAERINTVYGPVAGDYDELNAGIPPELGAKHRLASYLQEVDLETGLQAEMAFRAPHFLSMSSWGPNDPRVLTIRYEDFLGNEPAVFDRVFRFMGWGKAARVKAVALAEEYAGGKAVAKNHVRNKAPEQWRETLPPAIKARFVEEWGPLLRAYGYPET